MICNNCGSELKTDAKFCSVCGKEVVIPVPAVNDVYCSACGYKLKENSKFCSACGKAIETNEAPSVQAPVAEVQTVAAEHPAEQPQPVFPNPSVVATVQTPPEAPAEPCYQQQYDCQYQPAVINEPTEKQNPVLVFGIIALAVALSSILSFLGIIFGAIAMNKAKEYINLTGHSPARVSVGRGLGKAGLIAGIAMTVFWILYFILVIAAAIYSGSASFYYSF